MYDIMLQKSPIDIINIILGKIKITSQAKPDLERILRDKSFVYLSGTP